MFNHQLNNMTPLSFSFVVLSVVMIACAASNKYIDRNYIDQSEVGSLLPEFFMIKPKNNGPCYDEDCFEERLMTNAKYVTRFDDRRTSPPSPPPFQYFQEYDWAKSNQIDIDDELMKKRNNNNINNNKIEEDRQYLPCYCNTSLTQGGMIDLGVTLWPRYHPQAGCELSNEQSCTWSNVRCQVRPYHISVLRLRNHSDKDEQDNVIIPSSLKKNWVFQKVIIAQKCTEKCRRINE